MRTTLMWTTQHMHACEVLAFYLCAWAADRDTFTARLLQRYTGCCIATQVLVEMSKWTVFFTCGVAHSFNVHHMDAFA